MNFRAHLLPMLCYLDSHPACAPEVVLDYGMGHLYVQSPADGCFAVLHLPHYFLFPNRFADFRSCEIGVNVSDGEGHHSGESEPSA